MTDTCLYCYHKIEPVELETISGSHGYHEKCSRKFFGKTIPPELDLSQDQLLELAVQVVKSQKTVPGVQPKLSLGLRAGSNMSEKFTIVGLWGEYILKPQTEVYGNLPENEDLTMHLAEISKIKTVEHTLIRLKSGQLAYLTKRIDRQSGKKIHMEDMCQLTERLTEHKYRGSYEQIAKAIQKFSTTPGLDVTNFYELVLFSFLTGNNDMHLKNFSLLNSNSGYNLCPAYDLLASELVVEGDDEDLALTLNGKKKKIKKKDFQLAMEGSGLTSKVISNIFGKYQKLLPTWGNFVDQSFLPPALKIGYKAILQEKAQRIFFDTL